MMYANSLSWGLRTQDASIPWRLGVLGVSLLAAAATLGGQPAPVWREAPEYVTLFAPRMHRELYRAYVSSSGLDEILAAIIDNPTLLHTPGAWEPRSVGPWDAFGKSGDYDRPKLALLYGARRARVARGPRLEEGRVVETWTLVSPYPSASLERLESGTLRIVLRLPEKQ